MSQDTGGHYLDTGDGPIRLDPPLIDMRSTEIPETFTRLDGTVVEGVIHVVHAEGVPVPARLDTSALPGSGDLRHCLWHDAMVPPEQAVVMGAAPDDPTQAVYACRACMHFHGLRSLAEQPAGPVSLPAAMAARFIGRRDGLPTAPGGGGMTGLPLRCAHCGQPLPPEDAQEVGVEQGTSSNLLWIHRNPCAATHIRRHP